LNRVFHDPTEGEARHTMPSEISMLKGLRLPPTWTVALVAALTAVVLDGCEQDSGVSSVTAESAVRTSTTTGVVDDAVEASKPKLKPGAKTKVLAAAGDKPYDKTFDDLRFEIAVGQPFTPAMLPDKINAMKKQRIRIRGFILPTAQARGLKVFVLVRDNQECCFGPGAALYDCILIEMQQGKTAEFSIRPVTVEGTFDIQEVRGPDGTHLAIYHLEAESVQ
jgi:hypothetical protein